MLVLTRVEGDSIIISLEFVKDVVLLAEQQLKDGVDVTSITDDIISEIGNSIEIIYLTQCKGRIKLGFNAHPVIKILRKEVPKRPRVAI